MRRSVALAVAFLLVFGAAAAAQDAAEIEPGVTVAVPIVDTIAVDGDLSDWAALPAVITSSGPTPPSDPANTGSVTWQLASVGQNLVFSATVVDATIVAGQHGDDYWNEDSVELYVNFSGDPQAAAYGPGIAQITVSPIDIGNADSGTLTISGNNASDIDVRGFVFATADGWGLEIELPLAGLVEPADGATFGVQVQANGSSGGDRDTKLSWSIADVGDTSFTDPSVFGTGVFAQVESDVAVEATDPAPPDTDTEVAADTEPTADAIDDPIIDPVTDEIAADPVVTALDEPDQSRALLIAAVVSAVSIMIGGLWFERRRKAWEAKSSSVEESDPTGLVNPLAIEPPPVPPTEPGPAAPAAHGHDSVLDDPPAGPDVS